MSIAFRRTPIGPVVQTGVGFYQTLFPNVENPLSEGSVWTQTSPLLTKCQVSQAGRCHGTQTGGGGFNDSHGYSTILGGLNYEVEATVFKVGTPSDNTEAEILLRYWDGFATYSTAFGNTNSKGYELSHHANGNYAHVGRWMGLDIDTPTPLGSMVNGDIWRARIEGFRIRWWINEVLLSDVTDSDAALRHSTGYPGIGMFIGSGATNNTVLGFSKVILRRLAD